MRQILCSTGCLIGRPNNRNYHLLESFAKELSCDGFEFMLYSSWYDEVEQLTQALLDMKLHFPVMHCEKHIGQAVSRGEAGDFDEAARLFEINCQVAQRIGAQKLVLHLWDGEISDSHFENNLTMYGELEAMAKDHGVDLLVENVVCNRENPMKHWCELAGRYPQIHFVYDTKMAAFHEQMDLLYEEEYSWLWKDGHIVHYHVNDYAGGYMDWANLKTLPIGAGHVDFDRFFEFVRGTGYDDTFTVEATAFGKDGQCNVNMLNDCVDKIRRYMG